VRQQVVEAAMTDNCGSFFSSYYGQVARSNSRLHRVKLRLIDAIYDLQLQLSGALQRCVRSAALVERQSVLLAAVDVPGREATLRRVTADVANSRHAVEPTFVPMGSLGKFDNINKALIGKSLSRFDWLLIVDEDIAVPRGLLDILIGEALQRGFKVAQPAHRFLSYATFDVTQRKWAAVARRTRFVECGPVSLFHRDTFAELIPFPSSRWGWGLDIYWAEVARRNGWPIGVIDAAPIRHLRPVAGSYDPKEATEEAIRFLTTFGIAPRREDLLRTVELYRQ
jgi:hypothetical protein